MAVSLSRGQGDKRKCTLDSSWCSGSPLQEVSCEWAFLHGVGVALLKGLHRGSGDPYGRLATLEGLRGCLCGVPLTAPQEPRGGPRGEPQGEPPGSCSWSPGHDPFARGLGHTAVGRGPRRAPAA